MLFRIGLLVIAILALSSCSLKKNFDNRKELPAPTVTDDQMLQELESDPDFEIDTTTDQLNSDLQ